MLRIALTVALLGGCSFAFQARPVEDPVAREFDECSTSRGFWIADAAGLAAAVLATAIGVAQIAKDTDVENGNWIAGSGSMAIAGFAASMANGIRWANECREQ